MLSRTTIIRKKTIINQLMKNSLTERRIKSTRFKMKCKKAKENRKMD